MVTRNGRGVRTPPYIQLVTNTQGAASESLDLHGTEVRNDRSPLPDGSRANFERPRDIRGTLEVINNVLFQHKPSFTTVKTASQPRCQPKDLTLVDMDKLETIADRLLDAMKENDISASDLARDCRVSPAAVHKWQNGGRLSADNLAAAARALGVREEWLRTGKLPRAREHADEDRQVDRMIEILGGLREPLAALVSAIDQLDKIRPDVAQKRRKGSTK